MAHLTDEKLEGYLLLISATVTSVVVAPILGFAWASIDPIDRELAIPDSDWLFRLEFPISLVAFILIYIIADYYRRNFLIVSLAGFPFALFLYLMAAQFFTRWLKPLDQPSLGKRLLISLLFGVTASVISMIVGKLLTMVIVRVSFPKTKLQ